MNLWQRLALVVSVALAGGYFFLHYRAMKQAYDVAAQRANETCERSSNSVEQYFQCLKIYLDPEVLPLPSWQQAAIDTAIPAAVVLVALLVLAALAKWIYAGRQISN